jgi:hypothetical protein
MDALRRTGETDSTRSSRYVQRPSVMAPPGKNAADNEGRKRPRRFTSGRYRPKFVIRRQARMELF